MGTAVAASAPVWEPATPDEESIPGVKYRMILDVRAPYTAANIEKLENAIRTGAGLNNLGAFVHLRDMVTIESMAAHFPVGGAAGTPIWKFEIVFTKTVHGSPLAVIYGAVALLAMLAIAAAVVGYVVEKQIAPNAEKFLNPWVLVAGVVIILALTGRSFTSLK